MKRSTPKDVENRMRGIIVANKEPKAPRKSTKEENRANKGCSKETTAGPMDENDVVAVYLVELKRMNRGKVGRPFRCTGDMFAWILMIMAIWTCHTGRPLASRWTS